MPSGVKDGMKPVQTFASLGVSIGTYGSRGQQRSATLALKPGTTAIATDACVRLMLSFLESL